MLTTNVPILVTCHLSSVLQCPELISGAWLSHLRLSWKAATMFTSTKPHSHAEQAKDMVILPKALPLQRFMISILPFKKSNAFLLENVVLDSTLSFMSQCKVLIPDYISILDLVYDGLLRLVGKIYMWILFQPMWLLKFVLSGINLFMISNKQEKSVEHWTMVW